MKEKKLFLTKKEATFRSNKNCRIFIKYLISEILLQLIGRKAIGNPAILMFKY